MGEKEYVAKIPDSKGYVNYTAEEHGVWNALYNRQIEVVHNRACNEFIKGIDALGLSNEKIPQLPDVSKRLGEVTGWAVAPVKALISFKEFFTLLKNRKFPAATFIRRKEDLDYLKEPDIFHEIFGHCPLLTNQDFANFTQRVGEIGVEMSKKERVMLARLYWFTVEFGLIKKPEGLRIYGGGILSSIKETVYALEDEAPNRHAFDLVRVLRTDYRYDELQRNYFVINSFNELYNLVNKDLRHEFTKACDLGVIPLEREDVRSC